MSNTPKPNPANARASALLKRCGKALYGEHWKAPLANALGIGEKSLRDWESGKNARFGFDHPAWADIRALLGREMGIAARRATSIGACLCGMDDAASGYRDLVKDALVEGLQRVADQRPRTPGAAG